jgi:hypothetical protein
MADRLPARPGSTMAFSCTIRDRSSAERVAAALAVRGHELVAVRAYGHFERDPTSWWYGKPLMDPQLDGWWQVFSLDGRVYPSSAEGERGARAEEEAVAGIARAHGGKPDVTSVGDVETLRSCFVTVGLVHRR